MQVNWVILASAKYMHILAYAHSYAYSATEIFDITTQFNLYLSDCWTFKVDIHIDAQEQSLIQVE